MRMFSKIFPILLSLVLAISLCPAPALAISLATADAELTVQVAGTDDYPYKNASTSATDRWNFVARQCTSFVAWRLNNDNGLAFSNSYLGGAKSGSTAGRWSHAKYWGEVARSRGIAVDMNPAVGAVAWWSTGSHGHVAWVKSVDGSNVSIEEYNYESPVYHTRTISKDSVSGYIHFKDLGSSHRTSGCAKVSVASGTYLVQSKIGSRVIDIHNASQNDGENAKVWQPAGNASQIFNIGWNDGLQANYIQLKASGKFLDAEGGDAKASNVVQWSGNGGKNQNWVFEDAGDGYVYIRNLFDCYLDLANLEDANGANVQTWEFNGGDNQKWKLVRVSGEPKTVVADGSYIVQSKVGNRVIDIHNASKEAGENAKVWQPAGNVSQIFTVGKNSDLDANYIQLKASGLFLDSEGGGPYKGNVSQHPGNGGWNQNWFAESAGDGYYYIRNLFGYYLDLDNGRDENGANVSTWDFNGGDNQKWKLLKVSGKTQSDIAAGTYSLVSKQSGKALDIAGGSAKEGANAQIRAVDGSASQLFSIAKNTSLGAFNVKLKASGLVLDAAGGESKECNVAQYKDHHGWNQSWFFEDAGDGYYYVRNMLGYYLDVEGAKKTDGSNVGAYMFNGGDNQKWKLVKPSAAKASIAGATVAKVKAKKYTGKAIKPKPKVTYKGKALKRGTDYTLSYKNNKKRGTATITVKGKGNFKGTKTVKFKIK